MSKEERLSKSKASIKKVTVIILIIVLIIGGISGIVLYREHKLRRAIIGLESLTFDGMEFVKCYDYKLTRTFETSELICKTINADLKIKSVEGYEKNFEYIYVRSFFDGSYYERIK